MSLSLKLILFFLFWLPIKSPGQDRLPLLKVPLSVSLEGLDPTEAEDFISVRILMNLGQGLMAPDKNLTPILGIAKTYKVSNDKKTYTFKLKKSSWSDGQPLTAHDFVKGWQHTFSPDTKAKIAQNLIDIIQGAKEYKTNKMSDFSQVGIKALNSETLEIKLNRPAGYFLSLLTLPFSFPQRETGLIKVGTPTCGAYFISELKSSSKILLTPNSFFKPQALNQVALKVVTENAAQLSLYEKKELDIIEKLPSSDYERFKDSTELKTSPFLATYYIGVNINKKPFDNLTVRKVFFNSIDRAALKKAFKDPQIISSSWVPTPLPTSEVSFKSKVKQEEIDTARQLLKESPLELAMDAQEKNIIVGSIIQQQIKNRLGIDIQIKTMEWKSYIHYLSTERPSLFRFAWLAAFPDPLSHLNVFTSQNPNNYTGFSDKIYDDLVSEVAQLQKGPLRNKKILQAQKRLLEEWAIIIPLYHYKNYYLISSNWKGLEVTPMGILYFYKANLKRGL